MMTSRVMKIDNAKKFASSYAIFDLSKSDILSAKIALIQMIGYSGGEI